MSKDTEGAETSLDYINSQKLPKVDISKLATVSAIYTTVRRLYKEITCAVLEGHFRTDIVHIRCSHEDTSHIISTIRNFFHENVRIKGKWNEEKMAVGVYAEWSFSSTTKFSRSVCSVDNLQDVSLGGGFMRILTGIITMSMTGRFSLRVHCNDFECDINRLRRIVDKVIELIPELDVLVDKCEITISW
jgi:hypothetical protein